MTNTTDEYWEVNGVSLQTLGHNIETWGGSLQAAPSLRGEDILIPNRPGRVWTSKVADSVTREFSMWVRGADDNGIIYDQQLFRENWRALKALFYGTDEQLTITRRWEESSTIFSAVGKGQVLDAPMPNMISPTAARFQVDIFMADPFFYGQSVTTTLAIGSQTLVVAGDSATSAIQVELVDSHTNTKIQTNDRWVQYASLATGEKAFIDAKELLAYETMGGAALNTLGQASSSGDIPWLLLNKGSNTITYSRTGGTGVAKLHHQPVYL